MKRNSFRAALVMVMIDLSYMVPVTPGSAEQQRLTLPDLRLADGSGLPFALSRYLGNVVVVEFWATSCAPCINDLTFLNRLQGDFPGKPLMVIAVSEDDIGMVAIRAALAKQKLNFLKPFADPGSNAAQALNIRGLPTSFVLDRHGKLVMQVEGPQQWDRPDYEKRINFLMNEAFP